MIKTIIIALFFFVLLLLFSKPEWSTLPRRIVYHAKEIPIIFDVKVWDDLQPSEYSRAISYHYSSMYSLALHLYDSAIIKAQENNDHELEAIILIDKANTFKALGKHQEEASCLTKQLKIDQDLLTKYKSESERLKKEQKHRHLISSEEVKSRIENSWLRLGEYYYTISSYDSALHFSNLVLENENENNIGNLLDASKLELAALIKKNKVHETDKNIKRVINKINTKKHLLSRVKVLQFHYLKYNIFVAQGDREKSKLEYDSAINLYNSAINLYESTMRSSRTASELASMRGTMADLHYVNGEFEKSSDILKKSIESLKEINYDNRRFDNKRFFDNLRDLDTHRKKQDLARTYLYIVFSVILFSIVMFYQIKTWRKNIIISEKNEQLQTLMKEIHHRVKNNLQVISSLLDLQSQLITDNKASDAIKENKNRIRSMALIHQHLYGEGSIERIKVKEYIHNLCDSILASYHIEPGSINIREDVDTLELDIDTVVSLGLVLNELINNSLKYAFKDRSQGEIIILLKEVEGALLLKVKDNGKGFHTNANDAPSTRFGKKLLALFAKKLKADLEMYNDNGACVTLLIRKYKGFNNQPLTNVYV